MLEPSLCFNFSIQMSAKAAINLCTCWIVPNFCAFSSINLALLVIDVKHFIQTSSRTTETMKIMGYFSYSYALK